MNSSAIHPSELNMEKITQEVISVHQLQANTKKISVIRETEESFFVVADREMVTLILRNLLSNAIKFTPESGKIIIRTEKENSGCRVSIIDDGIGMGQDTILKIQENNYYSTSGTAQESGTGLGLMLCKDFLARNGGTLFIESSPDKGSIFSFILPLANSAQTA